jgi:hypothetical protein
MTGLDYIEKMLRSRILREWSNTIGYEMGSSPTRVYTTPNSSPVKNFKHGWKNDMVGQHGNIF